MLNLHSLILIYKLKCITGLNGQTNKIPVYVSSAPFTDSQVQACCYITLPSERWRSSPEPESWHRPAAVDMRLTASLSQI